MCGKTFLTNLMIRITTLCFIFVAASGRLLGTPPPAIHADPLAYKAVEPEAGAVAARQQVVESKTSKGVSLSSHQKLNDTYNATQHPEFRHSVIYTPAGSATGSLIFIGPFDSHDGFVTEWLSNDLNRMDPNVRNQYRFTEATGKWFNDAPDKKPYLGWYRYKDWHNEVPIDSDVNAAVAFIHHLIQQESYHVGSFNRIALVGYSQGANVALESSFRFPSPLGLVVSQRGVALESRRHATWETLQPTPTILTAGADDTIYYEAWVKKSCRFLQSMHVPVLLKTCPGLDHYRKSAFETQLTIKTLGVPLYQDPPASIQTFTGITTWTSCA